MKKCMGEASSVILMGTFTKVLCYQSMFVSSLANVHLMLGEFADDDLNGLGVRRSNIGAVQEGEWRNGVLVRSCSVPPFVPVALIPPIGVAPLPMPMPPASAVSVAPNPRPSTAPRGE